MHFNIHFNIHQTKFWYLYLSNKLHILHFDEGNVVSPSILSCVAVSFTIKCQYKNRLNFNLISTLLAAANIQCRKQLWSLVRSLNGWLKANLITQNLINVSSSRQTHLFRRISICGGFDWLQSRWNHDTK